MFGRILFIILCVAMAVYIGWSIYKVVIAIKERKKNKSEVKKE